jgi:hypothetical protein
VAFWLRNVWAEGNEREVFYNYYHRNSDGTFILEQVDISGIGVDLFLYKVTYNSNAINAITGYYYQSDIVKFIDTIVNNKVIKTKYFDKSNSLLYTRINTYMTDGFMNSIAITKKVSEEEVSRSWIFFEKDTFKDSYNYYAIYVRDKSSFAEENIDAPGNAISGYIVSEGRVNKNYQPLFAASRVRHPTKKTEQYGISLPIHISERYEYDTEGNDISYSLYHDSTEFFKMARLITDDYLTEYQIYRRFPASMIDAIVNLYIIKNRINLSGTSWVFQTLSTNEDANFDKYIRDVELAKIIQSYIVKYIMEYYINNSDQGYINKKDVIKYILGYVDKNDIDAEFFDHIVSITLNTMRKIKYIRDDLYIEYYFSEKGYYDEIENEVVVNGYAESGEIGIYCSDEKIVFWDPDNEMPESYIILPPNIFPDNYPSVQWYYSDDSILRPRMKR